jgi:hypothetical protein
VNIHIQLRGSVVRTPHPRSIGSSFLNSMLKMFQSTQFLFILLSQFILAQQPGPDQPIDSTRQATITTCKVNSDCDKDYYCGLFNVCYKTIILIPTKTKTTTTTESLATETGDSCKVDLDCRPNYSCNSLTKLCTNYGINLVKETSNENNVIFFVLLGVGIFLFVIFVSWCTFSLASKFQRLVIQRDRQLKESNTDYKNAMVEQ